MILVILGIIVLITIMALIFEEEEIASCLGTIFVFALLGSVLVIIPIVNGRVIDKKIVMYQEENKIIETQIETAVKEYMNFENKTFAELKTTDSYITLVTLYPELKSNKLVKIQLDIYISNNDKIKELKESKINISSYKWWLYFGGSKEVKE